MSISRNAVIAAAMALALLFAAGCSGSASAPASSSDVLIAREQHAVDALNLKRRYKDVVMGTDVKGTMLVVYVDVDNLNSMDEANEDALRAQTLAQWKRIWTAAHPHRHGTLRLSLRDYYGTEVTGDSARV